MTEKLIRDLIPEIARANGDTLVLRQATPDEVDALLMSKLDEERCEFLDAESTVDQLVELADLLEVINALACRRGASFDVLVEIAQQKRAQRGAFEQGWVMEVPS